MSARRRRAGRRAATALATSALAAVLLLGAEAGYVAGRSYLPAGSAPPPTGAFGTEAGAGAGRPLRLLLVGDSTAAGVGASSTATSVGGRLAAALAAGGRRVELSSVAVSGSRAADLRGQLTRALHGAAPDVAVVLIGANDATHLSRLGTVRRDLTDAVRRLRGAGVRVVVGSCPDLGAARAFPQPLRLVAAWRGRGVAAAEDAAAATAGARVVDLGRATGPAFRADPRTLSRDRFHPSDRGYRLWAQALAPAVLAAADGVAAGAVAAGGAPGSVG